MLEHVFVRVRVCVPRPHVAVQALQGVQLLVTPAAKRQGNYFSVLNVDPYEKNRCA